MRLCSRGDGRPVEYVNLCRFHYRKHQAAGLCGRVGVEPAARHVNLLRSRGWTWLMIGAAAGMSQSVPHRIYRREHRTVTMRVESALLAIEPRLVPSPLRVDVIGTRRRIQALSRIGWSQAEVCRRIDRHPTMLTTALCKNRITAATAFLVSEVYRELSTVEGPSGSARSKAALAGWAPPIAWEDVDIDDPDARPNVTGYDEDVVQALVRGDRPDCAREDRVEASARLAERGLSRAEIAALLDVTRSTVDTYIKEAA